MTGNLYTKEELCEFFDFILSKIPEGDGEQYLVAMKTTLHDIDVQQRDSIVQYLDCLKKMFEPLHERARINFQCSIAPYEKSLVNLQPEYDNLLREKNESKKSSTNIG